MTAVTIPSFTGGIVEYYTDEPITYTVKAGQTVTGGMLVELTAGMEVQKGSADSAKVVGVALFDADGDGEISKVTVASDGVWPLTATEALSAGDLVACDTAGTVKLKDDSEPVVGIALATIAQNATGPVQLRLGA